MKTNERDDLEYAGFWVRAWALFIDGFLLGTLTMFLSLAIFGSQYVAPDSFLLEFLIFTILPAAIVITFWVHRAATPGKMAISARIVDSKTGRHPSTARFIARYVGYILSGLPLGLGYIWAAFDKRKQGWHDKLAGTVVVRKKPETVVFSDQ